MSTMAGVSDMRIPLGIQKLGAERGQGGRRHAGPRPGDCAPQQAHQQHHHRAEHRHGQQLGGRSTAHDEAGSADEQGREGWVGGRRGRSERLPEELAQGQLVGGGAVPEGVVEPVLVVAGERQHVGDPEGEAAEHHAGERSGEPAAGHGGADARRHRRGRRIEILHGVGGQDHGAPGCGSGCRGTGTDPLRARRTAISRGSGRRRGPRRGRRRRARCRPSRGGAVRTEGHGHLVEGVPGDVGHHFDALLRRGGRHQTSGRPVDPCRRPARWHRSWPGPPSGGRTGHRSRSRPVPTGTPRRHRPGRRAGCAGTGRGGSGDGGRQEPDQLGGDGVQGVESGHRPDEPVQRLPHGHAVRRRGRRPQLGIEQRSEGLQCGRGSGAGSPSRTRWRPVWRPRPPIRRRRHTAGRPWWPRRRPRELLGERQCGSVRPGGVRKGAPPVRIGAPTRLAPSRPGGASAGSPCGSAQTAAISPTSSRRPERAASAQADTAITSRASVTGRMWC